jgi:hypothetical protein
MANEINPTDAYAIWHILDNSQQSIIATSNDRKAAHKLLKSYEAAATDPARTRCHSHTIRFALTRNPTAANAQEVSK